MAVGRSDLPATRELRHKGADKEPVSCPHCGDQHREATELCHRTSKLPPKGHSPRRLQPKVRTKFMATEKQHYISGPLLCYQLDEHGHTTIFLPFPDVFSIKKKKVLITLFNRGDIFPFELLFNIYFRTTNNIYLVFYYL